MTIWPPGSGSDPLPNPDPIWIGNTVFQYFDSIHLYLFNPDPGLPANPDINPENGTPNGIHIFSDPKQKLCSPDGLTGTVSDILWPMVEKSVSRA